MNDGYFSIEKFVRVIDPNDTGSNIQFVFCAETGFRISLRKAGDELRLMVGPADQLGLHYAFLDRPDLGVEERLAHANEQIAIITSGIALVRPDLVTEPQRAEPDADGFDDLVYEPR